MSLPLPPLSFDATLVPFAVVALSMVGVTIFLLGKVLPSDGQPPLLTQLTRAHAVLGGGSLLLLSLLFVFLNPNGTDAWTWVLLSFNFMMMAPAGIWFIGLIAFRDRRIGTRDWTWPATIALVTTGSEALMGVLFVLGDASSSLDVSTTLALGLSSVWFFWSMAAVMSALIVWAPLSRLERSALLALTASAVLAPWVSSFPTIGGGAMALLMTLVFVLLLRSLLRGTVRAEEVRFLFGLAAAFCVMAVAGLTVAVLSGSAPADLAFGATMGTVMGFEVAYLFHRFYHGREHAPWVPRRAEAGSVVARPPETAGRAVAPEQSGTVLPTAPGRSFPLDDGLRADLASDSYTTHINRP